MRPTKASSKDKKTNRNSKSRSVAGKGLNQQEKSHNKIIKGLSVIAGLAALMLAPLVMPKDPPEFTWNSTNSLPMGLYKRVDKRDVDLKLFRQEPVYITFCLPARLSTTSFYERFCSPDAPNKKRILKRLIAEQTTGGWLVEGDTDTSLDSRIFGPVELGQIQGFWRPLLTLGAGR